MAVATRFTGVLEALGAFDFEATTSPRWEFFNVKYRTPAGPVAASYLCLKHDCPLNEATPANLTEWKRLARRNEYVVVTTTRSELASNLEQTARRFGGRSATTPRRLLLENVVNSLSIPQKLTDSFSYFVEPDLQLPDQNVVPAKTYLVQALTPDSPALQSSTRGLILVAAAGLGKTTLCREIAAALRPFPQKADVTVQQTIPILVESAQWQNLISLTVPNILNNALLQLLPDAGGLTNPRLFQLLVREQILVPIFDGFDELCLHPHSGYTPARLLDELLDLLGDAEARVLITVRDTFWHKHFPSGDDDRLVQLDLQGFSNEQRKRFFLKRLKDPMERDTANRISREIGGALYGEAVPNEPFQADRASGVPLLLELIALYVDGNPAATFMPNSKDPLGPFLEAVCKRENVRQKLEISAPLQMQVFEELFRDFPADISREDLRVYLEVYVGEIAPDTANRFESHAFLSPGNDLKPRFEALRVYFVARWLANRLEEAVETANAEMRVWQVLEKNSTGNSDLFDYLANRFILMGESKARAALSHAISMVRARSNSDGASSALFHLAARLVHGAKDRRERTSRILAIIGSGPSARFHKLAIAGQIVGLDFSALQITACSFKNVEFRNCTFDAATHFNGVRFDGLVSFENCDFSGQPVFEECTFSDPAQSAWNSRSGTRESVIVTESMAASALREALRKFVGPFGFSSIKVSTCNSGALAKNPCRDDIWVELERAEIILRHHISGVTDGGYNIANDSETRHEVRSFLDNAALGPRLSRVMAKIVSDRS